MIIKRRAAEETTTPATITSLLELISSTEPVVFGCENIVVTTVAAVPDVVVTLLADIPDVVAVLPADVPTNDEVFRNFTIIAGVVEDASGPKGVASARSGGRIAALKSLWGHPLFLHEFEAQQPRNGGLVLAQVYLREI